MSDVFNETNCICRYPRTHLTLQSRIPDINTRYEDGWTALMIASLNGHTAIVEILLKHDANINVKSNNGCTALILASQDGYKEIVALLLKHGADVNAKDNAG